MEALRSRSGSTTGRPPPRPAPGHRRAARAGGGGRGHRARFRPDPAAARALRDRPHRDRHARRQGPRRQGRSGLPAAARRCALGAGAALRPRARPRLQRRHGRRGAAAHPLIDDVRLRVGAGPAHGQLPPGPRRGGPGGDPARAPGALRRQGQDPRLRGAEGGVLPRRLHPRSRRAARPRCRRRAAADRRPHPARRLALPPLREPALRRRAGAPACGRRRQGRGAAPDPRAARRTGRRLHRPQRAVDRSR